MVLNREENEAVRVLLKQGLISFLAGESPILRLSMPDEAYKTWYQQRGFESAGCGDGVIPALTA